jgi:hypothetical protein
MDTAFLTKVLLATTLAATLSIPGCRSDKAPPPAPVGTVQSVKTVPNGDGGDQRDEIVVKYTDGTTTTVHTVVGACAQGDLYPACVNT